MADERQYRRFLEAIDDGVYFVDRERRISYWNRAAQAISGFSVQEVVGRCCADNLLRHVDENGNALCDAVCPLTKVINSGERCEAQVFLHHKGGARIPVFVRANPLFGPDGTVAGAVETFSDNSTQHAYVARIRELERLALIDALTGLPNRRYFEDQLEAHLSEFARYQWPFGLLLLDVDHFKRVNDNFGHLMGDEVLKLIAKTLAANCRACDILARWGGEEFAVLLPNASADSFRSVADRLRKLVGASALRSPTEIRVTVSIGGTLAVEGDMAKTILQRADARLYEAKRTGRDRAVVEG